MIDLSLYKNHDWYVEKYDSGFNHLTCKKCNYSIRERYIGKLYFIASINNGEICHIEKYNSTAEEINIVRKEIYSCEEVIIKNLIE